MVVKMFKGLKNKIREETGNDVTIKVNPSSKRVSLRGRHSRHGSTSSLNSIISIEGSTREELNSSPSLVKTPEEIGDSDELQRILAKKEAEIEKRFKEKEKEWLKQLEQKDTEKIVLQNEKEELNKHISSLEESLKIAEEQKRKLAAYRDDKEQLENLQSQEIVKVKQLLLSTEKELAEKSAALKENLELVDNLRAEVSRSRHNEQELNCVQDEMETLRHASAREKASLANQLAQNEEDLRRLRDRCAVLERRCSNTENETNATSDDRVQILIAERNLLEQRLEEAHVHLTEIKTSWCEKITSLETQVGRLSRQAAEEGAERRRAVQEKDSLSERIKQLEFEVEKYQHEIATRDVKINRLIAEVDELSTELRDMRAESEEEVTFLRKQIETSSDQVKELKQLLADAELRGDEASTECSRAAASIEAERNNNQRLNIELEELRGELDSERTRCNELYTSFDKERSEKDITLLRNAQVSQEIELARQKIANQELELNEMQAKFNELEAIIANKDTELEKSNSHVSELQSNIFKLEEDVLEKDKNIKILQQRISGMKKTLQRELRSPGQINEHDLNFENEQSAAAVLTPSQNTTKQLQITPSSSKVKEEDDINFKYLKHVIIKFLTSREYEAKHLTRAVATLLKFSPDEEKLLQETLEWKMSWFGSRPKLGNGQTAKTIPPS